MASARLSFAKGRDGVVVGLLDRIGWGGAGGT